MNKDYILGVFKDEESLVAAFEKVKEKGILPIEVFTPYPVHEILHRNGKQNPDNHCSILLRIVCSHRDSVIFNLGSIV